MDNYSKSTIRMISSQDKVLIRNGTITIAQDEEERELQRRVEEWREDYIDYPAIVNIDTFTACNAKCNFCHQKRLRKMGRYGIRMSDSLLQKIVSELKAMPTNLDLIFSPHWWNETFIDKEIVDKMKYIVEELPQASLYITTNGELLTPEVLDRLKKVPRIGTLKFSINYFDKYEYEAVMKISYDKVMDNLRYAIDEWKKKPYSVQMKIGRVKDGTEKDRLFTEWVKSEFPGIPYVLFDYFPGFDKPSEPRKPFFAGCRHWFEINIAPDGKVGYCCVDSACDFPWGNAKDQNILEIYNNPKLRFIRKNILIRQQLNYPCNNCNFNV